MRASRCTCCANRAVRCGSCRNTRNRSIRALTIGNLHKVGSKLKNLPKGWKFETRVLTEDLSLDTMRSDGWASILRDELGCTYQACGYGGDTSANYVP